jgi:hypothetical protein
MPDLVVTRALPNPPGKDRRPTSGPTNDQLNNEWVEFANAAGRELLIDGVTISHHTFDRSCNDTGEDQLTTFNGILGSGQSVRLHTGSGTPWNEGVIRHLYVGRSNYAWNNACGDTAVLRTARGEVVDWASYDPQSPEGVVLSRVPGTNKLSPAWARTA